MTPSTPKPEGPARRMARPVVLAFSAILLTASILLPLEAAAVEFPATIRGATVGTTEAESPATIKEVTDETAIVASFGKVGGTTADTTTVEPDRSILRVSAEARVEVTPDRARISFAVETEGETAREAGEANARLMDQVVQAVQATDLPGLRTETTGYALTPRYQPSRADQPRVIIGYTARNTLQVVVDDVEEVGRLLDVALDAGANRVQGLHFEVRDPDPHRQEALREAVSRARAEAETIADALGVRLGDPLEVQVGGAQPVFRTDMQFARAEMMAMDAPTTPVEAGLQTISASVNLHYRIHP